MAGLPFTKEPEPDGPADAGVDPAAGGLHDDAGVGLLAGADHGQRAVAAVFLFDDQIGLKRALHYNAARSSMILPSEDLFEAMGAYLQKRKGNFKGA